MDASREEKQRTTETNVEADRRLRSEVQRTDLRDCSQSSNRQGQMEVSLALAVRARRHRDVLMNKNKCAADKMENSLISC